MATISDYLTSINSSKTAIKTAIKNKKVDIDDTTPLKDYASKIDAISATDPTIMDTITALVTRQATTIHIPDGPTTVGDNAFYAMSVKNVYLNEHITSLGVAAFSYCSGMYSFYFPKSITYIGTECFLHCDNLQNFSLPSNLTYLGDRALSYLNYVSSIDFPDSLTEIRTGMCSNDKNLARVKLPANCKRIYQTAFYNTGLTSIVIPNSVTTIDVCAFQGCSSLTSVTLPNAITELSDSLFYGCSALTSITIPASVTKINQYTFYGCTALKTITINKPKDSIKGAPWGAPSTCTIVWNG